MKQLLRDFIINELTAILDDENITVKDIKVYLSNLVATIKIN